MQSIASSEQHGGPDPRELSLLGLRPSDVVDFSVNSNPFGPSPRVRRAANRVDLALYPDRECVRLRTVLAGMNGVSTDRVLVANGSTELIWLVSQATIRRHDQVMIVGPTFSEYARAASVLGAEVKEVRAAEPEFRIPVAGILRALATFRPRLLFLCNPNNPTGRVLDPRGISTIVEACGHDTLLVLDEAYRAFVDGVSFSPPPEGRCVVLRSMTKDFAVAGLRLGYALGDPEMLHRMSCFQPAWSVNAAAQASGVAAVSDIAYYRETLTRLHGLSKGFFRALAGLGVDIVASDTHFALARLDAPACVVRQCLLHHGIQVRDCTSFGIPSYIRVATRLPEQNKRLIAALRDLRSEGFHWAACASPRD